MNVTALVDGTTGSGTFGDVVERVQYDPYGKPTFCNGSWTLTQLGQEPAGTLSAYANEILYCGYRYDTETGLYHVRHRMYRPTLGRWLERDPIGYVDGVISNEYVPGTLQDWSIQIPEYRCGPEIGHLLRRLLREIDERWGTAGFWERWDHCKKLYIPPDASSSWEIKELGPPSHTASTITSGPCKGTVAVDGKCYHAGDVNYLLWGKMNSLCGTSLLNASRIAFAWKAFSRYGDPFSGGENAGRAPKKEYRPFHEGYLNWTVAGHCGLNLGRGSYDYCIVDGARREEPLTWRWHDWSNAPSGLGAEGAPAGGLNGEEAGP